LLHRPQAKFLRFFRRLNSLPGKRWKALFVGASTNAGGTRCPQRVGDTAALAAGYLRF
jgi:hypothetical protein